jgi:hypothetical protein
MENVANEKPALPADMRWSTRGLLLDAEAQQAAVGRLRSPEQVVATGLRALDKGKNFVVDGLGNAVAGSMARELPAWFTARMAGRVVRPRKKNGS